MANITSIPAPRVPLIDDRTGLMSREWYRFFMNLFMLTGGGTTDTTLIDLQQLPTSDALNSLGTMADMDADNVRMLGFSTNPFPAIQASPPVGSAWWDGGTTLNLQMTGGITQPVGESFYRYIKASSAITKGQLVKLTGAVGASGVSTAAPTTTGMTEPDAVIGIAAENIALNGFGLIISDGLVKGINTSGAPVGEVWADGDILYYNPSVVGGLTKTKPSAPNLKMHVAEVINASAGSAGSLHVHLEYPSVLGGTDSNVQFGTLSNGDVVKYNSALGYWVNGPATATVSGTEVELDFGATATRTLTATVTDAGVSATSKVLMTTSGNAPTGRNADEVTMESFVFSIAPAAGSFNVTINSLLGPVTGKYKFFYVIGA